MKVTEIASSDIANVIKFFAQGRNTHAYKALMKLPEAEKTVKDSVITKMNTELHTLSSSSMLKKSSPDDVTHFNLKEFEKELVTNAPDTFNMLKVICSSKRKQKKTVPWKNAMILLEKL